jgi:hypothetical protein
LIKKKYSSSEEERFGPTVAAEHLAEEDGIVLDHDTYDFGCCRKGCGAGNAPQAKGRVERIHGVH